MNDIDDTVVRDQLVALAATTVVEDGWDDLVADLDRVVAIAPPSSRRRGVLAAASVAAAIAVVAVLAMTVRSRDGGSGADAGAPPRYFSFVRGGLTDVQVQSTDQPLGIGRVAGDDGQTSLALIVVQGSARALPGDMTTVDVGGTPVGVVVNGALRGASWSTGANTAIVQAIAAVVTPVPAAADVLRALDGLSLPQAGCTDVDPLCQPPAPVAALPAGDPLVAMLRALPALVAAPDMMSAPPPPGFHVDPLLAVHDLQSVDGGSGNLSFWRTDVAEVGVDDLRTLVAQQRLGQILDGPLAVTVDGRPGLAVRTTNGAGDEPEQTGVVWSPAPGYVAWVIVGNGTARPAVSIADVVALAGNVGEVTEAHWKALPRP